MTKAPSTLTAAILLAVFLCLGNAKSFAQYSICKTAVDYTCSGTYADCEVSTAGCSSTGTFQVSCDGNYQLGAKADACANACNCNACVMIVKVGSGSIAGLIHSNCENQSCQETTSAYLYAGYNYELYVCKRPCSENVSCEDCDSQCKAIGWVNYGITSCP